MVELVYEMTFAERIEGPLGPTTGFPSRLCWKIAEATLAGPRISARLAMPGTDWLRIEGSGIRRQDQRTQFLADQYMCMTPLFDVSSDRYAWLTQSLFIARGRLAGPKRIEYELYRVL